MLLIHASGFLKRRDLRLTSDKRKLSRKAAKAQSFLKYNFKAAIAFHVIFRASHFFSVSLRLRELYLIQFF